MRGIVELSRRQTLVLSFKLETNLWVSPPEAKDCVADIPTMVHFHRAADQTFLLAGRFRRRRSGSVCEALDNATTWTLRLGIPFGFVRGMDRAIIDEIQRSS
jgi:hypothetical protein